MQYLLLLFSDEAGWSTLSVAEKQRWMGAYQAYTESLMKAGVFKGANHLLSSTGAATVRVLDGKASVMDGPFAESKEQLAGYFIIEVPDFDTAVSWAVRHPAASHGAVEVRQLGSPPIP
jgi:hypothetical protein